MKKIYLLFTLLFTSLILSAQVQQITRSGSLEIIERTIEAPGQSCYSLYDLLNHGYWDPDRMLDYDSLNMMFRGNWPLGQSFSTTYSGMDDIFLLGSGAGVIVVDASNPENPEEISMIRARALVDASYYDPETQRLYLGAYFSGVEIWDVSDFENPARLARIPTTSYPRGGVFAEGDLLYVITVADGVYIYDISDINNIIETGHYPIPSSNLVWNSAMSGELIFCACGTGGCRIIDISDPYDPQIAGIVGGATSGVWVENNLLYTVSSSLGLKIHDVSDPGAVNTLGDLSLEGYPSRVCASDNYAYVANSTSNPGGGVQVVDVSDPENPVLAGAYSGFASYIAMSGQTVVTTGGGSGCTFLDVSDPASPQMIHHMKLPWSMNELYVSGDLGFTGSNGFRVFDISDKSAPEQIGYHETAGSLVAVSGETAVYIPKSMGGNNPVNIMDVSDPENPVKRGTYMAPVMTYDIDLVDQYAFIACWWDGFRVVDFSDPDNPALAAHEFGWVNSNSIPGVDYCFVQALDTHGDVLYLIDYKPFEDEDTKGLYAFDISDPQNPEFISRYAELTAAGYDLEVQDGYAYVADKNGGFEVIDVSDPANMQSLSYTYLPDVGYAVDVDAGYAYVANYILGGVQMINIEDPAAPFIEGYYKRSGCFGLGVTAKGTYAFLADGPAGFQIYDNLIITGTDEITAENASGVNIQPNPCHDQAVVSWNNIVSEGFCRIWLYDINGRRVRKLFEGKATGNDQIRIDVSGIRPGLYVIETVLQGQSRIAKLVIGHD